MVVGSQFACRLCRCVVVVAWIFSASNSELRTIRARSQYPVPWASSKSRAHERSRLCSSGILHGHSCLLRGLAVFLPATFYYLPLPAGRLYRATPRGLTSEDESRGREVIERGRHGVHTTQKIRKIKSKERPSSCDRSFEAYQTRYITTIYEGENRCILTGSVPPRGVQPDVCNIPGGVRTMGVQSCTRGF